MFFETSNRLLRGARATRLVVLSRNLPCAGASMARYPHKTFSSPRHWRVLSAVALFCMLPLLTVHATPAAHFTSLGELETQLDAVARGANIEAFWNRVVAAGTMPLVFGQTAVFLYRGDGESVEWRGDFSSWSPGWDARGERIGQTNIWRKSLQLLPGSRLDYKIVVDSNTWLFDPLNPHRQAGGSGANSEARMPDWKPSEIAVRHDKIPRGTLSDDQVLLSERLGYAVTYRVYTPHGLQAGATDLPSIYVTDGPDYYRDDWGAMLTVMDNLYARDRLEPVVAVFISQWSLDQTANRRGRELVPESPGNCDFCAFIVDELMPVIEANYPVSHAGTDRAILGTSLGGLFSTYMGIWHGDEFGKLAIQSPAYHYPPGHFIFEGLMSADSVPQQVFLNVGQYEKDFMRPTAEAAAHLRDIGVDLLYVERPDGHGWGHWRTVIDDALLFFYGKDLAARQTNEPGI